MSHIYWLQLGDVSSKGLVQDPSDLTLPVCWRFKFPIRYPTSIGKHNSITSLWVWLFQLTKSVHLYDCSSVSDVKQFFKPLILQFGSQWWIVSRKLRILPEGYLIMSVSISSSFTSNISSCKSTMWWGSCCYRKKAMCAWVSLMEAKYMMGLLLYLEVLHYSLNMFTFLLVFHPQVLAKTQAWPLLKGNIKRCWNKVNWTFIGSDT